MSQEAYSTIRDSLEKNSRASHNPSGTLKYRFLSWLSEKVESVLRWLPDWLYYDPILEHEAYERIEETGWMFYGAGYVKNRIEVEWNGVSRSRSMRSKNDVRGLLRKENLAKKRMTKNIIIDHEIEKIKEEF